MAERIWVLVAVTLFSGWHWQQLEHPQIAAADLAVLALLAAGPAVLAGLGRRRLAVLAIIPATLIAVWRAYDYLPWDTGHPIYPVRIASGVHNGAKAWFETPTPFDPFRFAATSGLVELWFYVLLAVFAWLLIDGRFALAAVATAFALFAIPSTAVGMGNAGLRAAFFLLLALAILAVCQRRVPLGGGALGQLSALAAATLCAGLIIGSAPGVAKGAFFDWRHWNPLAGSGPRVNVAYVWNQDYGPLHFPKAVTTMFEVTSSQPHYWKAGVLTSFRNDRWVGTPAIQYPYHQANAIGVPPTDQPPKAQHPDKRSDIVQVGFKIDALADPHLLSTGQPIKYSTVSPVDATLMTDGSVITTSDMPRGASYTTNDYSPNPSPKQLAGAGTRFPQDIVSGITVQGDPVPAWGAAGAAKSPVQIPIDPALIKASNQVWRDSGADDRDTSEYGAVVAVESYFHSPTFHYDQNPPQGSGPVLADFMLHSHRGYCQMYSGSMALVLRLHGIPARVAYGFTPGTETSDGFKVTDRDGHDWVEVYFPSYGWIPFEPTPTRHLPIQTSTTNAKWGTYVGDIKTAHQFGIHSHLLDHRLPTSPGATLSHETKLHGHGSGVDSGSSAGLVATRSRGGRSFLVWAISAAVIVIVVLALVKLAAVRWRYLRRGPRGQASAAYHELATYIGDQGVSAPANATFEDLAKLVVDTWGVDASSLAAAGSAARYAPPRIAERAGREVRPALRRIRRDLRGSIDLRDRLVGALRLRSMLAQTTHLD